ncbi:TonB-dependent receptor [Aquabacterium sp.]|uniref:TonB-dependent receptor n=1 Tax=Aquabacterium sp. TaxID=1872578 RepID=UPI002B790AB9|nr:TonB-dependent receptor [Aquabacterium sp.]HSW04028.1 TonB-dependent receptor [Aquabacterium sp.]
MNRITPTLHPVALAASLCLLSLGPAWAQVAAPAEPAAATPKEARREAAPQAEAAPRADAAPKAETGLNLEQVVVTGTARRTSKLAASVSISTLGAEQLQQTGAASAAEVLRSIPGIRSESSGGESNANVTIRGLPISAGGSRYVQFQEDGLPVLQIGDFNFATPDTWIRADNVVDRLEVVRGGSASTLATGAPGGIINFISKTGQDQGGIASITKGLGGYDQTRYEFGYGGRLGEKTRFYLGGHYREGEGARNGGVRIEQGMQIRGNITQQLDAGYVRLSFKHLDDHAPTLLPTPVSFAGGKVHEIAGFDSRYASLQSPYWTPDVTLTNSNGHIASNVNKGLHAKSDAVGVEAEFDLGAGFTLQEKFRSARNTGHFIGLFPSDDVHAAPAGTVFQTGPNAGSAYAGNVLTVQVFNTTLNDLSLAANDLRVAKTFKLGEGSSLQATAGFYNSTQDVDMTWSFNQYSVQAIDNKPALLNVPGVVNGSAGFGGCCQNTIAATYSSTAPYALLQFDIGGLTVEGSVRRDKQRATGRYSRTAEDGGVAGVAYNLASPRVIDYSVSHTSYSLGANFRLNKDTAVFARYSDGVAFNGDRITYFSDPNVVNGKSSIIPINTVKQAELGLKARMGDLQGFITLFDARTSESNVDATTTPIKVTASKYDAKGVELEASWKLGDLRLNGGLTLTNAKITASSDPAIVGKTPGRVAKAVYQLSPSYSVGDFTAGLSVIGTTKSRDKTPAGPLAVELPGYTVLNTFSAYNISNKATVALGINNLANKVGYTESNDGRSVARSINGRTAKLTLSYEL